MTTKRFIFISANLAIDRYHNALRQLQLVAVSAIEPL